MNAACLLPVTGQVAQATATEGFIEVSPVIDTWVDEAVPDASHADEQGLVARSGGGKGSRILLDFDLSRVEDAHVESAVLRTTIVSASGAPRTRIAASGIKVAWRETVTWETQPQFSQRTQTYAIQEVGAAPGTVDWDVTQLLQDTLEAAGTFEGIALSGPFPTSGGEAPEYGRTFAASEAGAGGPMLRIDYLPGRAQRATGASPRPSPTETASAPPGAGAVRIGLGLALAAVLIASGAAVYSKRRRGEGTTR